MPAAFACSFLSTQRIFRQQPCAGKESKLSRFRVRRWMICAKVESERTIKKISLLVAPGHSLCAIRVPARPADFVVIVYQRFYPAGLAFLKAGKLDLRFIETFFFECCSLK